MLKNMCLNLLLFCGIFSQAIIGIIADEGIKEQSDILTRQKRVITRVPGEDKPAFIEDFPYIVIIKSNNRVSCVGSILSLHIVITTSSCINQDVNSLEHYQVLSNTASSDHGSSHNVTDVTRRYGGHANGPNDGVALLVVDPPFVYGSYTNRIELHTGPLLPGTLGTVSGWGHNGLGVPAGTSYPRNLRSIKVPIIAHRACVDIYRPYNIEITDKDLCTYHEQKYCGHTDGGAPLVNDGYLSGVHTWTGTTTRSIDPEYPDVFAVLYYKSLIHTQKVDEQ